MNNAKWIDLAAAACEHARIKQNSIDIITTWEQTFEHNDLFRNNAVFRLSGQRILKIFGTDPHRHVNVEKAVLETVNDNIPAPRLVAQGIFDDNTHYIIMTEITGKTLQDSWDTLSHGELQEIARQIGHITAQLHQQSTDKLSAVESKFGGRVEMIAAERSNRIAEIKAMNRLSTRHKDELFEFIDKEAPQFMNVPAVLTHSDFSHAHIYVGRDDQQVSVSGLIDWAEAMLGPSEWDIAFHWLWTFSQDQDTMKEYLNTYYRDIPRPDQFARRCFTTHFFTYSMNEVWDYFTRSVDDKDSIVRTLIMDLFPSEVFGAPD